MSDKLMYFLNIAFLVFFLSACAEVNQNVTGLTVHQDSLLTIESQSSEDYSPIDTIKAFFSDKETTSKKQGYSAAYLDEATNDLFVIPEHKSYQNPYGFKKNELVTYPDSIYKQRFANISSEIPLVYNEFVENFIDLYAVRKRDLTERMFGKSILYFPHIERVLMEKGLPHELKYLTMVESALQANASSHMEAVGLWQIRYRTGKWLGLEIDDYFDQRRDPYVSTQAAINYLDRLHKTYGNWPMALAAYNSGPGNVNKAVIKAGGSRDYWKVSKYLPTETQSYVPAFMSIVYLSNYLDEHNIRSQPPELPFEAVDSIRIFKEVSLTDLASSIGIDEEHMLFLNPAFVKKVIPSSQEGKILILPIDKMATFVKENEDVLSSGRLARVNNTAKTVEQRKELVPAEKGLKLVEHRVQRGQTIGGISNRYGVEVKDIKDWNAMRNSVIRVGQTLKIYVPASRYGR